ncbi:hypothetical protein [Cylindrospermopsis raciborskii]|nr:hypothetical protein [Cylindrospermopsis raciborskii]
MSFYAVGDRHFHLFSKRILEEVSNLYDLWYNGICSQDLCIS